MVYTIDQERLSFEVNRTAAPAADFNVRWKQQPPPATTLKSSLMFRYFSGRAMVLMVLLTVSLLLLPLVLPPLPPPPLTLLLIPVAIMAVLVFLAFAPPQLPNVAFNPV